MILFHNCYLKLSMRNSWTQGTICDKNHCCRSMDLSFFFLTSLNLSRLGGGVFCFMTLKIEITTSSKEAGEEEGHLLK